MRFATSLSELFLFTAAVAFGQSAPEFAAGPKWLDSDRFDILAAPSENAGTDRVTRNRNVKLMLRALLADRFQLRMHGEAREMPAYVLSVAKGPPMLPVTTHDQGPQLQTTRTGLIRTMTFQSTPMPYFARYLSSEVLRRLVVDRTGIEGAFDFVLRYTPEMEVPKPDAPEQEVGPSVFTALEEQLGLRLRMRKVTVQVHVIDRAEKPSDN